MYTVLLVVFGYLCGSLPTGVWFGRRAGVDVRRSGSGNVGATNVARTAGTTAGLLTLGCDIAKGLVPTMVAGALPGDRWRVVVVGVAAVIGHIFPVFSRFSGGKGVATAFGVFLWLAPVAAAAALLVFLAVAVATQYVSLASVAGVVTVAVASAVCRYGAPVWIAACVVAGVIVVRHRDNLSRLWKGLEPKFRVHR
jgi:glycerol-3-phosphate acyltransferase PlsY